MTGNPTDAYWAKKFVASPGTASLPGFSFNTDPDTGMFRTAVNTIGFSTGGGRRVRIDSAGILSDNNSGFYCLNESASATNPTLAPNNFDPDTGMGHESTDAVCLISGAINAVTYREASGSVLQACEVNAGLTAATGSSQGDGVLTSSYNIISICANAGDAVTLPASFLIGTIVRIKNDGANSADVFPASGDDLGAGADTAAALAAGASITYIASAVSTTWTSIGN